MKEKTARLLVFIVAYNAEQTIESVLRRIPESLLEHYDVDVLIIDDSSKDETFRRSELVKRTGEIPFKITVLYNPVNQGYGGNQKIGFHYAVEQGYDWVALVHGDGQYAPECLPELLMPLAAGDADAVFGSRMLKRRDALKGGMPLYKFIGNTVLTTCQNLMLRSKLSEFHSGYRLYSVEALSRIPFQLNSNDFHFDTEIIIQFIFAGLRIKELPIPTFYGDEICYVNGLKYAFDVARETTVARLQPLHIFYEAKYDCAPERVQPEEDCPSNVLFRSALLSRELSVGTRVLLVGGSPAGFVRELEIRGCSLEQCDGSEFARREWDGSHFEVIYLLEGSGMAENPTALVKKLKEICRLSPEVQICVTSANIGFFLSRLSLLCGRFGYSRRGITNLQSAHFFTLRSVRKFFTQNGFEVEDAVGLPIPWSAVFDSDFLRRLCEKTHCSFIRMSKSLFAFQFILRLKAPTTLEYLLLSAEEFSGKKAEEIGEETVDL